MAYALIVSGGKGIRMGSEIPKQFLLLEGIPILVWTLMKFDATEEIDSIILVLPGIYFDYYEKLGYKPKKPIYLVEAGEERQDSVRKGLEFIETLDRESIVVIHDGVRPLVTEKNIQEGIALCRKHGAAACGVKPKDTVKTRNADGFSSGTLDREGLFLIHTPQVFHLMEILRAHQKIKGSHRLVTDDTMVYEEMYGPVYLYEGSYQNIKITTKEDLIMARNLLK